MLYFLKLGGSLITDKNEAHTARVDVITRLAQEIQAACHANPDIQLLIGHGSGSFGHFPAKKYGTRQGVHSREDWTGFIDVWNEARALNQILVEAFQKTGLPVIAFPPSASVIARDAQVEEWDLAPIQFALSAGLIPLINGDTIFDTERGGTILSTEDLFVFLAPRLTPSQIFLAGIEDGVWADYPERTQLLQLITPEKFQASCDHIIGSTAIDVTGGMGEKVSLMLHLTQKIQGLQALIFSGLPPGRVYQALTGEFPGTIIRGEEK